MYETILQCSPETASRQIILGLKAAGFRTRQSFNLKVAENTKTSCGCAYHGTALCTCQIAVLLVYDAAGYSPITLMIHGHEDHSLVILPDCSPANLDLQADVFESLVQFGIIPANS